MDGHTIKKRTKAMASEPSQPRTVRGVLLEVMEGPCAGARWESDGDRCAIGSHPACDLHIDDPTVSRFHCEVLIGATGAQGTRVRDLGSVNGVILDGVRVIDAFLRTGSLLRLGQSVVRFQYAAAAVQIPCSPRTSFGSMVGRSAAMRTTFALLERVAATDLCVLLEGETGTGKSLAAESIHQESGRRGGPFLMVNCAAIPATLMESELFGHVKGAFTGAVDRAGAFESAHGGTLFLDEIGELPHELQAVLLTVLDRGVFHRVGASEAREADVRVIAASNRDLRAEVNAGRFREDLYYRLAVLRVPIPALRERREDLPHLVEALLSRSPQRPRRDQIQALLSDAFIERLGESTWPGNIRELRNHLEQCLAFEQLPPGARAGHAGEADDAQAEAGRSGPEAGEAIAVATELPYRVARQRNEEEFKRAYVTALLRRHGWNVARAAEAAGIGREYCHRLIRALGIEKPDAT